MKAEWFTTTKVSVFVASSVVHREQRMNADFRTDHVPAKKFGLRPSVWIRRTPGGEEALMGSRLEDVEGQVNLAATFGSLGEFAGVVEKAFEKA